MRGGPVRHSYDRPAPAPYALPAQDINFLDPRNFAAPDYVQKRAIEKKIVRWANGTKAPV